MPSTPVRVLPTAEAVGDDVAARILARLADARRAGRRFLLGFPTGRTPRPILAALGRRLAAAPTPLDHLVVVMMDEYLVPGPEGLEPAPAGAPWACRHFAATEIAPRLGAPTWFPDPRDPAAYDARIADAGGIDLFVLASGASDGHVAFNPPGTPRDTRTRVVDLPEATRRDNLLTSPAFATLDAVPHHGVTVGIATIAAAREAVMVVLGEGKRRTLARMREARGYDPEWPATVIHVCAGSEIVCDAEAAGPSG